MIRSTHGSRYLAAHRWNRLCNELGHEHPAARAASGRLRYHRGSVPQRDSVTPEAIAWFRESGCAPGYWNRGARKAARRRALAQHDAFDLPPITINAHARAAIAESVPC